MELLRGLKKRHDSMTTNKNKTDFGIVYLVQEKIILLHVRHTLYFNPLSFSAKQQREITSFWVQFYSNTKLNLSFVAFTSI